MPELIVSVSGIRGIVGESLTPDAALRFAGVLGNWVEVKRIVLSRDGRRSGEMLGHAVLAGLIATGCDVLDIGIAPTASVGVAVRELRAGGGIQITASHNPAQWNGLKLFGYEGRVLSRSLGEEIRERFQAGQVEYKPWDKLGKLQWIENGWSHHLGKVLSLANAEVIASRRPHVLVDANGGAGGKLAVALLERLGCAVTPVACETDGVFRHEPEPTEANVAEIGPRVTAAGADIGMVLDPDADRLALIDERGRYIGEELTLALAVMQRLSEKRGPVVINMSTSRVTEDICKRFSVPCYRAPVGEANVVDKMLEVGAEIGGEGNGGVIDLRVGGVRDPFIGAVHVLSLLATSGKSLSETCGELPRYEIVKTKAVIEPGRLNACWDRLRSHFADAAVDGTDGLRFDWDDRWLHVRASNTEPIVRIIAEALSREAAAAICEQAREILATRDV